MQKFTDVFSRKKDFEFQNLEVQSDYFSFETAKL